MTAKELRIGNYVKLVRTGEVIAVNWMVIKYVHVGNIQQPLYDMGSVCEPIPLTEEILLKCGFEKYGGENLYHNQLNKLEAYKHPMKDGYGIGLSGYYTLPHIKYLHKLQNLYFALTGAELDVKL